MEIRTLAEISIQQEKMTESEADIQNQIPANDSGAALFFIQRMDFLRAWASEYKGSSVNAD